MTIYVRFPFSLRNVEDPLRERGIEVSHETVLFWWQRFGPMFAAEIRRKRLSDMRASRGCWHLDEVFAKIDGVQPYLSRAVDHEGEMLEAFVLNSRDRQAALKLLRKVMKRHGRPQEVVTDKLRSHGAALKELGTDKSGSLTGGRTTGPRTRTSRSEVERGPCSASGACTTCRRSPPFMDQRTTTSTPIEALTADPTIRPPVPPLSPSAGALRGMAEGAPSQTETNSHSADSTATWRCVSE